MPSFTNRSSASIASAVFGIIAPSCRIRPLRKQVLPFAECADKRTHAKSRHNITPSASHAPGHFDGPVVTSPKTSLSLRIPTKKRREFITGNAETTAMLYLQSARQAFIPAGMPSRNRDFLLDRMQGDLLYQAHAHPRDTNNFSTSPVNCAASTLGSQDDFSIDSAVLLLRILRPAEPRGSLPHSGNSKIGTRSRCMLRNGTHPEPFLQAVVLHMNFEDCLGAHLYQEDPS